MDQLRRSRKGSHRDAGRSEEWEWLEVAINQAHEAPLCTEANSNFAREFTEGNTHKTHGEQLLPANPNLGHEAPLSPVDRYELQNGQVKVKR